MEDNVTVQDLWKAYLLHNDDRVFKQLVDKVIPLLVARAIGYTKDKQKAEDIVGDVIVKLLEYNLKEKIDDLQRFLHTSVKNACNNEWTREGVRQRHVSFVKHTQNGSVVAEVERLEDEKECRRALKSLLTPKEYEVFDKLSLGYSTAECAEIMQLSKSRVDNLQTSIRNRIRKLVETPDSNNNSSGLLKNLKKVFASILFVAVLIFFVPIYF